MAKYDWESLRKEYLIGEYKNLKDFAEKNGLKYNSDLRTKAAGWRSDKLTKNRQKTDKIVSKTIEKTIEKVAEKESSRQARILSISDKLADKIEKAVEQLESYIVTNKVKTKTITYDPATLKPSKEIVVENEVKDIVSGIIDKHGLKQLTAALKDIKDLYPVEDNEPPELPDDGFMAAMKDSVKDIWADETGDSDD